jgi:nucleoside-diphosphate-sugar epimerase
MKVLVVGATGVVGRQLVPQLLAAGHEVVATSHSSPPPETTGDQVEHRRLDLLDHAAVSTVVQEVAPDAIVHTATALSGLGNNVRRFDQMFALTNQLRTAGTTNLIDASRTLAALRESRGTVPRWPRLVVQSFCGWPWARTGGPVKSEEDALDPDPPKAFRKTLQAIVNMETQVTTDHPDGVVLRFGGLYGAGTSLTKGPQYDAVRKGWFPLIGSGGGIWSFVHTADAASATLAALTRGQGIYNIVDDDPAPVAEWLPELARLAGGPRPRRVPTWVGWLAGGDGLVRMMTSVRGSSNAKARAELGWVPRYPSWRDGFAAEFRGGS